MGTARDEPTAPYGGSDGGDESSRGGAGAVPARAIFELGLGLLPPPELRRVVWRVGDTGKIWNERKFKHVTETDQIFEFKVEADRILCFFFVGRRLILTHGFKGAGNQTPKREIDRAEAYKKDFEWRENMKAKATGDGKGWLDRKLASPQFRKGFGKYPRSRQSVSSSLGYARGGPDLGAGGEVHRNDRLGHQPIRNHGVRPLELLTL